jgi:hypothetical protein
MKLKLAILLAFCCSQVYTMAQPIAPVPVQFSGVVISEDGSTAISFASVQVLNKRRGTVADENGFFSFVAMAGDTIQFSALGYTTTYTLIPTTISNNEYSVMQLMEKNVLSLPQVTIYPFSTPDEFKTAFLAFNIPSTQFDIAQANLGGNMVRELSNQMSMDAAANQNQFLNTQINKASYYGNQQGILNPGSGTTPIPSSLANPFAWAQFFKALKSGQYKKNP